MLPYLIIPAMAAINAFRGGRIVADERLPGRNLYIAAPLVFLVCLLAYHWTVALAWAATYLFWGAFSWGHLIGMGFFSPSDRKAPPLEQACMALSAGVPTLAMAWRELFILPGLLLVGYLTQEWWIPALAFPFALVAALSRRLAWEGQPQEAIPLGEILEGVAWGVLIVFTYFALTWVA